MVRQNQISKYPPIKKSPLKSMIKIVQINQPKVEIKKMAA